MKKPVMIMAVLIITSLVVTGCHKSSKNETTSLAPGALSGRLSTNGSTSMEKVVAALIEAFNAENTGVTITYDATGSSAGIAAALDGTADIGLSSRNLKESETGLNETIVALDGIVIIVNNANVTDNLTVEQVAGLFTGEITNWSQVGGNDAPVALIGREAGSGTRDGFESIVGVKDICLYDQELTAAGAVISAVNSNEYAIGYTSLSALSEKVKPLDIEGIACTEDTLLDGSYAIQRPYIMVTSAAKAESPVVEAFLEFALSDKAADIIAKAGAVQAK